MLQFVLKTDKQFEIVNRLFKNIQNWQNMNNEQVMTYDVDWNIISKIRAEIKFVYLFIYYILILESIAFEFIWRQKCIIKYKKLGKLGCKHWKTRKK